jgi:hypothetical protein
VVVKKNGVQAYFAHSLKKPALEILACSKDYPKGIKCL